MSVNSGRLPARGGGPEIPQTKRAVAVLEEKGTAEAGRSPAPGLDCSPFRRIRHAFLWHMAGLADVAGALPDSARASKSARHPKVNTRGWARHPRWGPAGPSRQLAQRRTSGDLAPGQPFRPHLG